MQAIELWGIFAPVIAGVAGAKLARKKPKPVGVPQRHARGGPAPVLRYCFTLYGEDREEIPSGQNPIDAAAARTAREGKPYSARRI